MITPATSKKKYFTLSLDQKKEIKEAFDLFDCEKKGFIDYSELKVTLKALGFEVGKKELGEIIREFDPSDSGHIEYQDFLDLMTRKYATRDPLDEIRLAYKLFVGEDMSGKITVRALRRVAREINENLSEEELKAMIDEFDFDEDGMIGEDEFIKIMTGDAFDLI